MLHPEAVRAALGLRNPSTEQGAGYPGTRDPLTIGRGPVTYVQASQLKVAGTVCGGFLTPGLGSRSFLSRGRTANQAVGYCCYCQNRSVSILNRHRRNRSIAAVLAGLDESALERVAIDVVREQRCRLEHAQALYEKLSVLEAEAPLDEQIEGPAPRVPTGAFDDARPSPDYVGRHRQAGPRAAFAGGRNQPLGCRWNRYQNASGSISYVMRLPIVAAKLECPVSAKLECHTPRH
jgi:hypothetical protein